MLDQRQPTVTIIIKALNEERHIAGAIESALAALKDIDGEVILADSASTDRTVDIAQRYPIRIVRLTRTEDRSCGVGAQLGFQYSRGRFVCLIDGDMALHEGFLPAALTVLRDNPTVAGVGGRIIERETGNLEFVQRAQREDQDRRPGPVSRLDCGGVYRRTAIESVGYFTDRNLHGGEELDLGARLRARGWTLARIDRAAIDHHGHAGSPYRLLIRRLKSGFASSTGEVVRGALGRPHFRFIFRNHNDVLLTVLVFGWWASMAKSAVLLPGLPATLSALALFLLPIAAMSVRWRSLRSGLYSVAAWNVGALAFLPGFLRSRRPPAEWIESTIVVSRAASDGATPQPIQQRHSSRPTLAPQRAPKHDPEKWVPVFGKDHAQPGT